MIKCLIATSELELWKTELERPEFASFQTTLVDNSEEAAAHLAEAEVAIGIPFLLAPGLEGATNLKWVQSTFTGFDALCAPGMRRDYALTNMRDVFSKPIAEYVFAHLLAHKNLLAKHAADQANSTWNQVPSHQIAGSTMTIFGTGSIGSEIARTAKAFGIQTIGINRSGRQVADFDQIYTMANVDQALAEPADTVVTVLPDTPETSNYFDAAFFDKLQGSPLFINVGRGQSVVEHDLIAALDQAKLDHAVLDVFQTEPLPKSSPLWSHDKVTVTPHKSGYISMQPIIDVVAENCRRYVSGEELMHLADFEKGY